MRMNKQKMQELQKEEEKRSSKKNESKGAKLEPPPQTPPPRAESCSSSSKTKFPSGPLPYENEVGTTEEEDAVPHEWSCQWESSRSSCCSLAPVTFICAAHAQSGLLHACAGALLLRCWLAIFSTPADCLALQNLPLATWQKVRLPVIVLQVVFFILVVSGVRGPQK